MSGAMDLSARGVRSSLFAENRLVLPGVPETDRHDLLFDPQTGGGLLAAIGTDAEGVVEALREDGFEAAVIGRVTDRMLDGTGQIEIV